MGRRLCAVTKKITDLHKAFKEIRVRSGVTLREIESVCGVSASTVSRFENGQEKILHSSVKDMFGALGYDLEFSVTRTLKSHSGKCCSFAESRPCPHQIVEVLYPDGVWRRASYFSIGIDGIILCSGTLSKTEIAEFPGMLWKPWRLDDKKDN